MNDLNGLISDCERLAVYHSARRHWLEGLHRWIMFLIIVSGSAAVGSLLVPYEQVAPWLAAIAPILGAADLVFGLSIKAHDHAILYQRFCELLGEIRADADAETHIGDYQRRIHRIFADEPPEYRALSAWCHNLVCDARGAGARKHKLKIPRWHIWLRNVFAFNGAQYECQTQRVDAPT